MPIRVYRNRPIDPTARRFFSRETMPGTRIYWIGPLVVLISRHI